MSEGHVHRHTGESRTKLTRNQSLVLGELGKASRPMSAYAILDELRGEGLKAPLQVYRALDKLVANGDVHRLETLNAFVACSHGGCGEHSLAGFMICETCGSVTEFEDAALSEDVARCGAAHGFSVRRGNIELIGTCSACHSD